MQKVKLGYTQSGIAGFFTNGLLALHLGPDAVREIKEDPNAAFDWAKRFQFEFVGYHQSWQLTQDTLNAVHDTIVSLTLQYDAGLITPFELIHTITGLEEGLGNLIHSDMAGLTCPNTGLKFNTMQRKPVDTGNDEEEIETTSFTSVSGQPDWKMRCIELDHENRDLTDKINQLAEKVNVLVAELGVYKRAAQQFHDVTKNLTTR